MYLEYSFIWRDVLSFTFLSAALSHYLVISAILKQKNNCFFFFSFQFYVINFEGFLESTNISKFAWHVAALFSVAEPFCSLMHVFS